MQILAKIDKSKTVKGIFASNHLRYQKEKEEKREFINGS